MHELWRWSRWCACDRDCESRGHAYAVAESYGVWVEKSMYGKKYFGNQRTTFIVDAGGKVAQVLRKVKPTEHDERVLQALQQATRPDP